MPNVVVEKLRHRGPAPDMTLTVNVLGDANTFDRHVGVALLASDVSDIAIVSDTTIAADAVNNWTFTLQNGATVLGTYSTAATALTADTAVSLTVSNPTLAALDDLRLVATEAGTAADLSAVRLTVTVGLKAP